MTGFLLINSILVVLAIWALSVAFFPGKATPKTALKPLWTRSNPTHRRDGPVCGDCGQSARGVSTLNCPECGADYREVGILHPGQGHRGFGVVGRLVLWSLGMLIGGAIFYNMVLENLAPVIVTYQIDASLEQPVDPRLGPVLITITSRERVWRRWSRGQPARFHLELQVHDAQGNPHTLHGQSQGTQFHWQGYSLTTDRLRDFLAHTLVVPAVEMRPVAADIVQELQSSFPPLVMYSGPRFSSYTGGGTSNSAQFGRTSKNMQSEQFPDPWFVGGLVTVLLALWVAGCVRIIRGNARSSTALS